MALRRVKNDETSWPVKFFDFICADKKFCVVVKASGYVVSDAGLFTAVVSCRA